MSPTDYRMSPPGHLVCRTSTIEPLTSTDESMKLADKSMKPADEPITTTDQAITRDNVPDKPALVSILPLTPDQGSPVFSLNAGRNLNSLPTYYLDINAVIVILQISVSNHHSPTHYLICDYFSTRSLFSKTA